MGNVLQRPAGALNSDEYIILVGNIPWRGRWQDLKDIVREITPNVQRVEIYLTPDGRSRGFGYVIVKEKEAAANVVARLDGYEWHGRALMVKLGNEANAVPVLAQSQPQMSVPDGVRMPDYLPVPPLPTDYNNGANTSPFANLVPSQVAAYNEWIAIQAYHHYNAMAHNLQSLMKEHLSDPQFSSQALLHGLQNLNLSDHTPTSPFPQDLQQREALLEEYLRQANTAQRNASYHSAQHHTLLQEEHSRSQDRSLSFQSSSSASSMSSSSPFSYNNSRRDTPNQTGLYASTPNSSLSPTQFQQHQQDIFSPMFSPSPNSSTNYSPQRGLPDNLTRRVSFPFLHHGSPNYPSYHPDRASPYLYASGPQVSGMHLPNLVQQHSPNLPRPSNYYAYNEPPLLPSYMMNQSPVALYPRHTSFSSSHSPFNDQRPVSGKEPYNTEADQFSTKQPDNMSSRDGTPISRVIPPTPLVVTNAAGVPINLSHGAVQTESRGIFIGNLPYNTHWRDLRAHLSSAGRIIRCDVPRKPNNKGRGYATVLFTSSEDASRACDMFNGAIFQGRPMRVRLDTYANTKTPLNGTVGSGSAGSRESGSGGKQSSFFTDGDIDRIRDHDQVDGVAENDEVDEIDGTDEGRKSSASV